MRRNKPRTDKPEDLPQRRPRLMHELPGMWRPAYADRRAGAAPDEQPQQPATGHRDGRR